MKPAMPIVVLASALAGLAGASDARAEPLRIVHEPFGCVLAGRHPRVEARLEGEVVRAWVRFRGDDGAAYQVPMRAEGDRWVAVLPQPLPDLARLSYRIEAYAVGSVATAPPADEEFIADVVGAPCVEGGRTAAVADVAEITLGVPHGRPRVPPGFRAAGVAAFVTLRDRGGAAQSAPRPAAGDQPAVASGSRVRVFQRGGEKPPITGDLVALEDDAVAIRREGRDRQPVRLARADVERIEVYRGGRNGAKVVGGLAGMGAGLAAAVLYYAAVEDADTSAPLFIGVIGGLVVGIAAAPGAIWEPVALWPARIGLAPTAGGVRVVARIGF